MAYFPEASDRDIILAQLVNLLSRFAVDSSGRLRIVIDVAGTATPVTLASTVVSSITSFPYGQAEEMKQRGDIQYDECQRGKMTF